MDQSDLRLVAGMNLSRLTGFVAVARRLSFTRAADDLQVAQPWLSTQVRSLERDLGLDLVDRSARQIALTPTGTALLPFAEAVISGVGRLTAESRILRRQADSRLVIGTPPYATNMPVRRSIVREFSADFPQILVRYENRRSMESLAMLDAGEVDLAFVMDPVPVDDRKTLLVDRLRVCVLIPPGHELYGQEGTLTAAELAGHELVVFSRHDYPDLFDRRYAPLADIGIRLVESPDSHPSAVEHFALDRGTAAISAFTSPARTRPSGALVRPFDGITPYADLYLVMRRDHQGDNALAFWDHAHRQAPIYTKSI